MDKFYKVNTMTLIKTFEECERNIIIGNRLNYWKACIKIQFLFIQGFGDRYFSLRTEFNSHNWIESFTKEMMNLFDIDKLIIPNLEAVKLRYEI